MTADLGESIADLALVDNHVHGFWMSTTDRRGFENGLNEANTEPLAEFDSGFDTQIGFAVRADCAPLLGLPPHTDPDEYLVRRSGFRATELAEIFRRAAAAARWRDGGGVRLTDRVLLRFGIHQALRLGKPLQFHVGLGDRDCDLHRTNPLLLLDFLRQSGAIPIVLLHCYPYEREAGYLAQAFNNVYLDTGLTINHLGARTAAFLSRSLELAPFRKILYSSDAYGPPELHYLGARLWRGAVTRVLTGFVSGGQWSPGDAVRVARLIGRDNAMRLYRL